MKPFQHTLAVLACATASICFADPVIVPPSVHVVFDNPIFNGSGYDAVNITYLSPTTGNPVTQGVAAGRFQGIRSNVQGIDASIFVGPASDLFMYCYDIYQHIGSGWSADYTIKLGSPLARTGDFLGAVNAVLNQGTNAQTYDRYAWLHPLNANQGAAIQLGIWESKYDTEGWNLADGKFKASALDANTTTWMNAFLGALNTSEAIDSRYLMTLESAAVQDMITADPPTNNVPEPGSLLLLGTALAVVAAVQRRKARPVGKN